MAFVVVVVVVDDEGTFSGGHKEAATLAFSGS